MARSCTGCQEHQRVASSRPGVSPQRTWSPRRSSTGFAVGAEGGFVWGVRCRRCRRRPGRGAEGILRGVPARRRPRPPGRRDGPAPPPRPRLTDTAGESVTIAEQQCLELMHRHLVGDESAAVEARSHTLADISGKRLLDCARTLRRRVCGRRCPTGPVSRHPIVVDHHGRDARWVLPQMIQDVAPRCGPWSDSAATVASAGAPEQPCSDTRIATPVKMRSKYLINERLFGLALDVDEQSGHPV